MKSNILLTLTGMTSLLCFILPHNSIAIAGDTAWLDDPLASNHPIKNPPFEACSVELTAKNTLELAEAIHLALCHNPQTRISWANVLTQAANLGSARSAYLPSVTGTAGLNRNFNHIGGLNTAQTTTTPGISLDYLLFDFGARSANNNVTKQGLIAADYTHNATMQNVLFSAVQAYYQLFSTEALVKAAAESAKSSKTSMDAAEFRHKVGAATIADQLLAETAYSQSELTLEQAKNQQQIARGTLANVMGISPDVAFSLPKTPPKSFDATFSDNVTTLLDQAKIQRPDLAASLAQTEASKSNIDLQRANGLPTVSLSAGQQYDYNLAGAGSSQHGSMIGATLHIPFFTGFNNTYQIKAAQEEAAAQIAKQEQTENAVLLDVWNSYNNYDTAKHTLNMTKALLSSATKSQAVALGRYKTGAGSITDLLSAESQLASARQQRVTSEYNWMITKADLLRALGQLEPQSIKKLSTNNASE